MTDHLIFCGAGACGGPVFFPQEFRFIFFRLKTREFYFSQSETQNIFFQDKAKKKKILFLNSIYAQNVFF